MGGTKLFMTFATRSTAPELPYLGQEAPTQDAAASFFVVFYDTSLPGFRPGMEEKPGKTRESDRRGIKPPGRRGGKQIPDPVPDLF